jgi:2-C-methyl-D-erythritol 2,4-cyclodiphosphate synthase
LKSADEANVRIGYGYDVHRISPARRLVLGGVEFEGSPGLEGYSDADVLLHAVMDALLGASALGDIGKHFPNTDPRYKDSSSLLLLRQVGELLARHRFRIGNIDSTVVLDAPKIAPHVENMRANMAEVLHIPVSKISVKATTQEGLGFVGAGQGIIAYAVAVLFEE